MNDANPPMSYPLRIEGALDQPLSRGLWSVKWILAIPHLVIIAFLWVALLASTVAAWLAILFTSRYPRSPLTSTSACCAGPGASGSIPTARWGPIATHRSRSTMFPAAQPASRWTTRRSSREGSPSSSRGCSRSRTT